MKSSVSAVLAVEEHWLPSSPPLCSHDASACGRVEVFEVVYVTRTSG